MKALVTGGAGFIGSHLCHELIERGHHVRVLDDLSSGRKAQLDRVTGRPGFLGLAVGGVAEERVLRGALTGIDTVYHLAGRSSVGHSLSDPADTFANDVAATFRVLEEVRHRRLRLVFVSSGLVYGSAPEHGALDEDHRPRPASPLAGCKLAAEALVLSQARSHDLSATVVRPFTTYGPGQRADSEGGVVSIFCRRALLGQTLVVHGDGLQTRDLLYVEDCARLLASAGESSAAVFEVVNAGTGLDLTINELAERIRQAPFARAGTSIEHIRHPHQGSEVRRLRCDASKAQRLLGWRPQVSLDEGLARTAAWLRQQ